MAASGKTKYVHLRYRFPELESPLNPLGLDGLGGVTVALKENIEDNTVTYAFAICRWNENYNRKLGRRIVDGRMKMDECYKVPCGESLSWSDFLEDVVIPHVKKRIAISNNCDPADDTYSYYMAALA